MRKYLDCWMINERSRGGAKKGKYRPKLYGDWRGEKNLTIKYYLLRDRRQHEKKCWNLLAIPCYKMWRISKKWNLCEYFAPFSQLWHKLSLVWFLVSSFFPRLNIKRLLLQFFFLASCFFSLYRKRKKDKTLIESILNSFYVWQLLWCVRVCSWGKYSWCWIINQFQRYSRFSSWNILPPPLYCMSVDAADIVFYKWTVLEWPHFLLYMCLMQNWHQLNNLIQWNVVKRTTRKYM